MRFKKTEILEAIDKTIEYWQCKLQETGKSRIWNWSNSSNRPFFESQIEFNEKFRHFVNKSIGEEIELNTTDLRIVRSEFLGVETKSN